MPRALRVSSELSRGAAPRATLALSNWTPQFLCRPSCTGNTDCFGLSSPTRATTSISPTMGWRQVRPVAPPLYGGSFLHERPWNSRTRGIQRAPVRGPIVQGLVRCHPSRSTRRSQALTWALLHPCKHSEGANAIECITCADADASRAAPSLMRGRRCGFLSDDAYSSNKPFSVVRPVMTSRAHRAQSRRLPRRRASPSAGPSLTC